MFRYMESKLYRVVYQFFTSLDALSCDCHFDVPVFCGVHSNDHMCGA